jgi:hypothetical protein
LARRQQQIATHIKHCPICSGKTKFASCAFAASQKLAEYTEKVRDGAVKVPEWVPSPIHLVGRSVIGNVPGSDILPIPGPPNTPPSEELPAQPKQTKETQVINSAADLADKVVAKIKEKK